MRIRTIAVLFLSVLACALAGAAQPDAASVERAARPAWAALKGRPSPAKRVAPRVVAPKASPTDVLMPPPDAAGNPTHTGRLFVKFQDDLKIRAGRQQVTKLSAHPGVDLTSINDVMFMTGGNVRQAIDTDPQTLRELELRASTRSNKAQPDLAGILVIEVGDSALVPVARQLLALPEVEWVEIETTIVQSGNPADDGGLAGLPACTGCGTCPTQDGTYSCFSAHNGGFCDNQVCCNAVVLALPICQFEWDATCVTMAQNLQIDDGPCATGCDACGDSACIACNIEHEGSIYCSDGACCALVEGIRPTCNQTGWDEICVALSKMLCFPSAFGTPGGTSYDTCLQPFEDPFIQPGPYYEEAVIYNGHCFQQHPLAGCDLAPCCRTVCFSDPNCCTVTWDLSCADLALQQDDCYQTVFYAAPATGGSGTPTDPYTQAVSPLFTAAMLDPVPPPTAAPGSVALAVWNSAVRFQDPYSGPNPPPPTPPGPWQTFLDVVRYRGGGLDMDAVRAIAQSFDPLGLNYTDGFGTEIAVVDIAAFLNHEDLLDSAGDPVVTLEPDVGDMLLGDDAEHGTAILGLLFGQDNDFGILGTAYRAEAMFFPAQTETDLYRLQTAITNAIVELSNEEPNDLSPANILVIPLTRNSSEPDGLGADQQPLNTSELYGTILGVGIAAGVTTIIPAGNAAGQVGDAEGDSGAVIVTGGCWPGFLVDASPSPGSPLPSPAGGRYCRTGMSNFGEYDDTSGAGVTCAAWGSGVCTLGYGDLFLGENPAVISPAEINHLRTYTARFDGTSASCALVGGLAACMQGIAKQVYEELGIPPDAVESVLANHVFPQCGVPEDQISSPGGIPAVGDTLPGPPTGNLINGHSNAAESAHAVITGDYFSANGSTPEIITGKLVSGNAFSIQRADQKYFKVRTQRPSPGQSSNGFGPALMYPPSNRVTDVQVTQPTDMTSSESLDNVGVFVESRTTSSGQTMLLVFLYNAALNRWDFLGFDMINSGADQALDFPLAACQEASDYLDVSSGSGILRARFVTIGFGGGIGQYGVWHDLLDLAYNNPLIPVPDPCGG